VEAPRTSGQDTLANRPTAAGATGRLLERERELEALERAVAAAVAGTGSTVALEGEAGIGKTSLLARACRCGQAAGMRVLRARGGELEREFAYGVVRQLFESTLASAAPGARERWLAGAAQLAALVVSPAGPAAGTNADAQSILHGLYWLSVNLAERQPLLLAVDDAQWADDASIAFLSYLGRRANELAVLVVYASRIGEGACDALPAVAAPETVGTVLRPAPLSSAAATTLVELLLASPGSERFNAACHHVTTGNPFLLTELLRAVDADRVAPDDAGALEVDRMAPLGIARATLARLRGLGPAAVRLAYAVAVLGSRADLHVAARLADLDDDGAVMSVDALTSAAILHDVRPVEFIHPIVRTTIYNELGPGRLAASHKRAARLLAEAGVSDAAIAPHLLVAEPSGDAWVVARLRSAAQDAYATGALDAACTYLDRATLEPPAPAVRPSVLLALGTSEVLVGRPAAVDHLREVLTIASDVETRSAAAHELAWALAFGGRLEEAVRVSGDLLPEIADGELRLRFEGEVAAMAQFVPAFAKEAIDRLRSWFGDGLEGRTTGERLVLACLASDAGHPAATAANTAALARMAMADGRLLHEHRPGSAPFFLAIRALVYADALDEAERYLNLAIAAARERGSVVGFGAASAARCQLLIRRGRIVEAEAEAHSMLAATPHAFAAPLLQSCVMHTMLERSPPSEWEPFLADQGIDGDLSNVPLSGMLLFSRAKVRLAGGDPHAALRDLEALRAHDELAGSDTPVSPTRACGALARRAIGELDAARELAAEEVARARRWGAPRGIGFALRTAGLVAGGTGGIELLRESVARFADSPSVYGLAHSLTELGAALRRAGFDRDARDPLRQALDLADRCGALRLMQRAKEELIATGARPRRRALSGSDALTPSERRVAWLAADGLSNPEIAQALFVTMRTVEGHLTQTYSKLGIASREQLPEALGPREA
jgi:DNA-binding CsgD family transcriptional regulator